MKTKSIGFGEAVKTLAAEAGMQPYRFSNFDKKKEIRFKRIKIFLKITQIIFIKNYLSLITKNHLIIYTKEV